MGVLTYFGCQWLLTILVVWLSDDHLNNAGNLALAMSVTNFFCTIALYNVRVYQVSDINGEYNDSEYVVTRIVTCIGAVLLCAAFVFIIDFSPLQRVIILVYMIFRANEAFIDVLHGIDQKNWRMDYIGISLIIRGISKLIVFAVLEWYFDLWHAVIGITVVTVILGFIYDVPKTKRLVKFTAYAWTKVWSLLKRCFPLMLVILSGMVIVSFARYSIERIYGTEVMGIYASVVAPTLVVQVAISVLFAPLANMFAECLKERNKKRYISIFLVFSAIIVACTIIVIIASNFLGEWGLDIMFNEPLITNHAYLLPGACVVVGLTATLWFMNVVFASLRDIKGIFAGNMIGMVVCFSITGMLLRSYSLDGANYAMIISQGAAIVCLICRFFWYINNKKELFEQADTQA